MCSPQVGRVRASKLQTKEYTMPTGTCHPHPPPLARAPQTLTNAPNADQQQDKRSANNAVTQSLPRVVQQDLGHARCGKGGRQGSQQGP